MSATYHRQVALRAFTLNVSKAACWLITNPSSIVSAAMKAHSKTAQAEQTSPSPPLTWALLWRALAPTATPPTAPSQPRLRHSSRRTLSRKSHYLQVRLSPLNLPIRAPTNSLSHRFAISSAMRLFPIYYGHQPTPRYTISEHDPKPIKCDCQTFRPLARLTLFLLVHWGKRNAP